MDNRAKVIEKAMEVAQNVCNTIMEESKTFSDSPDFLAELIHYITHVLAEITAREMISICAFGKSFQIEDKLNYAMVKQIIDLRTFEIFELNKDKIDTYVSEIKRDKDEN